MRYFFLLSFLVINLNLRAEFVIQPQTGHAAGFNMVISPDGKRMVSAGSEGKIILWDMQAQRAVWSDYPHAAYITAVQWRDDRYFLTASADSTLIVWDTENMSRIREYKHQHPITAARFNPKADLLVYGDPTGMVKMIHLVSGETILTLKAGSSVNDMVWAENGFILFVGTSKNGVRGYQMDNGKKILDMAMKSPVEALELSEGNKTLLIHLANGGTEVWLPNEGKGLGSIQCVSSTDVWGNTYWVRPTATADGKFVLLFDKDRMLQIGRLEPVLTQLYDTRLLDADIRTIACSPQKNAFVMSDMEGGIWICYFTKEDFEKENRLYWRKMQYKTERIRQVYYLEDGDVIGMKGHFQYEFNLRNGDLSRRNEDSTAISNGQTHIRLFTFDKLASGIIYYADQGRDELYKLKNETFIARIPMYAFTNDTNIVAMVDNEEFIIYDLTANRFIRKEKVSTKSGFQLFNGNLNDYFLTQDKKGLHIINAKTGTEQILPIAKNERFQWLNATKEMLTLFATNQAGKLKAWNLKSQQEIILPENLTKRKISQFDVSPDGSTLFACEADNKLTSFDLKTGQTKNQWKTKFSGVLSMAIDPSGKRISVSDWDGVVHVFDAGLQKNLVNIVPSPANGLVAYTPDNHYISTKEAAQNLALVNGKSILGFEQLEIQFNRPDKVLANIGLADAQLIAAYEKAFQRRIKRAGMKETIPSNAPELEITNIKQLPISVNSDEISLHLKSKSSSGIAAYRVWIDGVPLNGKKGFPQNEAPAAHEMDLIVPILFGTNKVEIAAVNTEGVESIKSEFTIVSTKPVQPELYILSIGVSKYKDNRFDLKYADKDAKDLVDALSNTRAFRKVNSLLLTNQDVTREKIIQSKDFLKKSKPNDVVIVFVAGHGLRDDQFDYYFATHDIDFNDPSKRGISDLEIESVLDAIGSLRKLLFFDTCLSGEVDKEDVEKNTVAVKETGDVSFRNPGLGLRNKKPMGIENAQYLMKEIFNDVKRGTGSTVIASAGGAEFAMESNTWKNGLFTYCLLNGLQNKAADGDKDGEVTLIEIQGYIRTEVSKLSGGKQIPDFKAALSGVDYRLW